MIRKLTIAGVVFSILCLATRLWAIGFFVDNREHPAGDAAMKSVPITGAVIDNGWSWVHPTANSYNFTFQDSYLSWAKSVGAKDFFASLIYAKDSMANPDPTKPAISTIPTYVQTATAAARKSLLLAHIDYVMAHYKPLHGTGQWVVSISNECCATEADNNWVERLRPCWLSSVDANYPALILARVKADDPSAICILTDNNLEYDAGPYPWNGRRRAWLLNYAKQIHADGVGIQGHVDDAKIKAGSLVLAKYIDDLHAAGLKAYITEADVGDGSPASWSELARQSVKADGFFCWGLTDQFSWRKGKNATLFDAAFKPLPALAAVKSILAPPTPPIPTPSPGLEPPASLPATVVLPWPGGDVTYSGQLLKKQ